jgi:DNA-binding response OmpR family regulator
LIHSTPPESNAPQASPAARRRHVLVVDDDAIVLEVVRERLEAAGYRVSTRRQELGTALWIATHRPDFVLLDVMMPALSGGEIASLVQRRGIADGMGIIFHSSKDPVELEILVNRSGALGAICKTSDELSFMRQFESLASKQRRS